MTVYTDKELPQKAREAQAQLEREVQKTCGCKQFGYGDWILCDYHKEKGKDDRVKLQIHGIEGNPEFAFRRIPEGRHETRATVYPDTGEPFDIQVPAALKDGTLTYLPFAPDRTVADPYYREMILRIQEAIQK